MPSVTALQWREDACYLLDQTKIPWAETYLRCETYPEVISAIKSLAVRGAPLIGIAGAYAVFLAVRESQQQPSPSSFIKKALEEIENARPTAVNLRWAVGRMRTLGERSQFKNYEELLKEAGDIHEEDIECNRSMAGFGSELFGSDSKVLTCCNTGDLATGGIGTAFGVFRAGFERGHVTHVYACETRPVLQGLRLTTWELDKNKIPYTVICDNMAASLMQKGKITHVITGADRIAANGDSANKIGTYSLAVLAKHHNIPFYIAAPFSTFDLNTPTGNEIPIEQRNPDEITKVLGPENIFQPPGYNPSFDVTPASLITAIVCNKGIIENPTAEKVRKVLCHA